MPRERLLGRISRFVLPLFLTPLFIPPARADLTSDFSLGGATNFAVLYEGGMGNPLGNTLTFNSSDVIGNIGIGPGGASKATLTLPRALDSTATAASRFAAL